MIIQGRIAIYTADPFSWLSLVFFITVPRLELQLLFSAAFPSFSLPLATPNPSTVM